MPRQSQGEAGVPAATGGRCSIQTTIPLAGPVGVDRYVVFPFLVTTGSSNVIK
jgi:hypothetical protein